MTKGRKEEFSFRDLTNGMVLIVNDKNLNVVQNVFEHKINDNAILVYGYVDHTAGITFEVLCVGYYGPNGEIKLNKGRSDTSFKLRYDSITGSVVLLNDALMSEYQDKLDMIKNGYAVNDAVTKARNSSVFDDFRHPQFPDDVMLLFYKDGYRTEGIWCRIESEIEGKPAAIVLNEPNADFDVHRGEMVTFEWVKQNEKMIGIAVLPWMKEK